jgi:hypothetical protein
MNNDLAKFSVLLILTGIFGALPFGIYFLERAIGSVPAPEAWYATGINHGPWRNSPESLTIYYPLVVLLIVTSIMLIAGGSKEKRLKTFGVGGALVIIQIVLLVAQMFFLTWLVD